MLEIIQKLEQVKNEILKLDFTLDRSIQVDRLDLVIDWLKEKLC